MISKRDKEFRENIGLRVSFETFLEDVSKESGVVINRRMDMLVYLCLPSDALPYPPKPNGKGSCLVLLYGLSKCLRLSISHHYEQPRLLPSKHYPSRGFLEP